MNCTAGETAVALWFLIVGVWIAFGGVVKWLRTKAFSWRETPLAIAGALGAVIGLWMTIVQIRCGFPLPHFASFFGPLAFVKWTPTMLFVIILFMIVGALTGWHEARNMEPGGRIAQTIVWALFGLAASEATAFHTGPQATRWFVLGMVILPIGGLLVKSLHGGLRRL